MCNIKVRIFVAVLFLVSLVKVGSLQMKSKYLRASDNKKMEIQTKHSGQEINAYFSEELSPPVHSSTGPITKQQKSAKPTTLNVRKRKFSHPWSHSSPCKTITRVVRPQDYFKTLDSFFPRNYVTTDCTGGVGTSYPVCGSHDSMDCVTMRQNIQFMRKPSSDCTKWYKVTIHNVPVACSCMWPY